MPDTDYTPSSVSAQRDSKVSVRPLRLVSLGNRIRELRLDRAGLFPSAFSVTALAHRVGVTDGMLRRWERGSSKPSRRHARALAKELGVSVDQLGLQDETSRELQPLAAAIILRENRVLLTERRFPGHGEQWSWPSGKVEAGESLEDAILRELYEELLIPDARVIGYIGDIDLPSGFRMSHFHVAIPPDAEPKLNDYEQLVRTQWMTRDEAREAFQTLAPEIAGRALAFLDQVLSRDPRAEAGPSSGVEAPGRPAADGDPEAARAERRARREEWARQSSSSSPSPTTSTPPRTTRPLRP